MKKVLFSFILIALALNSVFSQVPSTFNYQAVVRTSTGEIITNKDVSFYITLLKDSETGTVLYAEVHKVTTNNFGMVNFKIGEGTVDIGEFSPSNWGDVIFLKVEFDPEGGKNFSELSTTKLSSVPFAFEAQTVKGIEVEDDGDVNLSKNLNVDGKLSADEMLCNSNLSVSYKITVGSIGLSLGEIYTTTTGQFNNLLPFAYGTITKTGGKIGCTANVGTITKVTTGQFNVSISGLGNNYTIIISPYGTVAFITASVYRRTDDSFNGLIWDTKNDAYYDGGFSFVVYKP